MEKTSIKAKLIKIDHNIPHLELPIKLIAVIVDKLV